MKANHITILGTVLLAMFASSERSLRAEQASFLPNELSIDGFGFYASLDKGGGNNEAWGYGVGLNYFLTEKIGVGVDTFADAFEAPYLLDFTGTYRYPLIDYGLDNLAPYGIAGIGRQWEHAPTWFFDFGAGAEYRFQQNLGFFADLRGVFPVDRDPYALFRFGFRISLR